MPKMRATVSNSVWIRQRELGQKQLLGHANHFTKGLYSSILPCSSWDHGVNRPDTIPGGIFNLEFSPEGSLLVAACEKKSILIFDPLCRKLVHTINNAHHDCVNCVRFLDSRVFATGSNDTTVALWDARNLKSQIRILDGHSDWVKNIEFSSRDGLLVTSGFDGNIYTWDINSYTENSFLYKRVVHTNGLMRTRLNADASKMIVCTNGGFLMIVHNLDLNTLAQDLNEFEPDVYRVMKVNQTTIPAAAIYIFLFLERRKVNTVEFISDFPKGDDAQVVSSLQIHPQGWCALSRNTSMRESSEWTCVHDIQELCSLETKSEDSINSDKDQLRGRDNIQDSDRDSQLEVPPQRQITPSRELAGQSAFSTGGASTSDMDGNPIGTLGRRSDSPESVLITQSSENIEVSALTMLTWETLCSRRLQARELEREWARVPSTASTAISTPWSGSIESSPRHPDRDSEINHKVYQNVPRLTHYIEEPNVGKGYIKEVCFSADGRLICSPCGSGIRLLSFSPDCSELSMCYPHETPVKLHEIATILCHPGTVVSSKFSPRHCLLVSGCLNGKIVWYQPIIK